MLMNALDRRIPLVTDCPTIIFGADVIHSLPGDYSNPSIAAVCCQISYVATLFLNKNINGILFDCDIRLGFVWLEMEFL